MIEFQSWVHNSTGLSMEYCGWLLIWDETTPLSLFGLESTETVSGNDGICDTADNFGIGGISGIVCSGWSFERAAICWWAVWRMFWICAAGLELLNWFGFIGFVPKLQGWPNWFQIEPFW